MGPMAARLALALLFALTATACGGEPAPTSSTSRPVTVTTTATTSTPGPPATETPAETATPGAPGRVRLPADAPRTFDGFVDAADLRLASLAPPGASVGSGWRGTVLTSSGNATTQVVVFSWSRGDALDPESGLEVWERRDTTAEPPWRVAFAFTDAPGSGVLGIRFETGDLTGDRSMDVLSFEDIGGSGACGTWRVVAMNVASYREVYRDETCDTDVRITGGDLLMRAAVYRAGDAHCCPSAYRITRQHWDGEAWTVADRSTEPA
jgi:hypothetical protein